MSAPYDLKNVPASALEGFPFDDAAGLLMETTGCTQEEANSAVGECIVHPRSLGLVARDRFTELWLSSGSTAEEIEAFLRLDAYAEYVRKQGALIEVIYRGTAWTCEVSQVGKRELYWT